MKSLRIVHILFILFWLLPLGSNAQLTKILGQVSDSITKEALPFVNIYFQGTTIGTTSDFEGGFSMESSSVTDTLIFSAVGYVPQKILIEKGKFQEISISLYPDQITLSEVVITPGRNPAEILLEKVIAKKSVNNHQELEVFQYEVYNRIQIDVNNIDDKFMKRRLLRPFDFVFDNVDTSSFNGKVYLPLFLTESLSDFYYLKNPKTEKEIIKASKVSGLENESVSQFLGNMYQDVNVYDNYVTLFNKNFVSPIANFGLLYYRYYLVDSTFIDGQWCYQLMFKPRRKQELTFTGELWIHDTTFAVRSVEVHIADGLNLNLVKDLAARMDYRLIDGEYWMLIKEDIIIDFNVIESSKNLVGFFGHKTTSYKDFVFGKKLDDKFYSTPINIEVIEGSFKYSEDYWKQNRHIELTEDQQTIYKMVDSVKTLPAFNTYLDIIQMIATGYYVTGPVEIGPYMSTYSFNQVEGSRFRLGGRTSNDFSTRIMIDGHVAYGLKDKKWKYGGGFVYMMSKNPRRSFGAHYKYDIEQLGQSENAFREDFLLNSVFRRHPNDKLSMVNEARGFYEHEWFNGFTNTLELLWRDIYPVGSSSFTFLEPNKLEYKSSITTAEIRLRTRFAYGEKFVMGEFERISLGTKYPILEFKYSMGIQDFLEGDHTFHKFQLSVKHRYNIGSFGHSKYQLEAGQILGKLPYPLLKLHEGNETYSFDRYSFNLMNYYEFVSDRYISLYYAHHFDGFFLNRIPLIRKLKWREVAWSKGLVGDLSSKNQNYSQFLETLSALSRPYFEAGLGIENIFMFLRLDAVWRLSYLDKPNVNKFGVMMSMHFDF